MRRPLIVFGFMMLLGAAGVHAQDAKSHVADAKREYAAIFSHPESPCTGPDSSNTVGYETCMSKELDFLQPHLDAFLAALRLVEAGTSPATASSGNKLSSVQLFDKTTAAWKSYRNNLCQLAFSEFDGGTGAAPAEQQCLYEQDRAYVKTIAGWTELKILAD
jgi:uncharacterized protein YecT (DUF1311 family)